MSLATQPSTTYPMLSVIIPAYNEAHNIGRTLKQLERALEKIDRPHEVIVVCDGCTDNTATQVRRLKLKHVRVVSYPKNRGKGYALTVGTNASKGAVITFLDAGEILMPRASISSSN